MSIMSVQQALDWLAQWAVRSVTTVVWIADGAGLITDQIDGDDYTADVRWIISDTAFRVMSAGSNTGPDLIVPANVLTPLPHGLHRRPNGTLVLVAAAGATVRANLYRLCPGSQNGRV